MAPMPPCPYCQSPLSFNVRHLRQPRHQLQCQLGSLLQENSRWSSTKNRRKSSHYFEVNMLHREAPPTLWPELRRPASGVYPLARDRPPPPSSCGKGNSTPITQKNMPPTLQLPMLMVTSKQQSTRIGPLKHNNKQSVGGCAWFEGRGMNTPRGRDCSQQLFLIFSR